MDVEAGTLLKVVGIPERSVTDLGGIVLKN